VSMGSGRHTETRSALGSGLVPCSLGSGALTHRLAFLGHFDVSGIMFAAAVEYRHVVSILTTPDKHARQTNRVFFSETLEKRL